MKLNLGPQEFFVRYAEDSMARHRTVLPYLSSGPIGNVLDTSPLCPGGPLTLLRGFFKLTEVRALRQC